MSSNLRPVWDSILEIYKVYAAICEKHHLTYWAGYGTVLGAVRHRGFIPWDDDFDVLMSRAEYDRFLSIVEKELPSHLKLVSMSNSKDYPFLFCKIQDSRREVFERVVKESGTDQPQGLYIDIFAIDGVSDSCWGRFWDFIRRHGAYARMSRLFRHNRHSSIKGWLGELCGILCAPFFLGRRTERDFLLLFDKWARENDMVKSCKCGRYRGDLKGWAWIAHTNVFDGVDMLPFEDIKIPCPKGWDEYLKANYGDYMKLPPPEKRVSCHWGEASWKFGPTGL